MSCPIVRTVSSNQLTSSDLQQSCNLNRNNVLVQHYCMPESRNFRNSLCSDECHAYCICPQTEVRLPWRSSHRAGLRNKTAFLFLFLANAWFFKLLVKLTGRCAKLRTPSSIIQPYILIVLPGCNVRVPGYNVREPGWKDPTECISIITVTAQLDTRDDFPCINCS
jgi:hypothetical protein